MSSKAIPLLLLAVLASACSSAPVEPEGQLSPEAAVVAWFEAIDAGEYEAASGSVNEGSLAVIMAIENNVDTATLATYLTEGVPANVQATYWRSFGEGFADFASRPISTLAVGKSESFSAEGSSFSSVPISGGEGSESVVITRMAEDGSWQIDLVASLADGFVQHLVAQYQGLPADESGDTVREIYRSIVVPALWAGMSDGSFGDGFTRSAMAVIDALATTG